MPTVSTRCCSSNAWVHERIIAKEGDGDLELPEGLRGKLNDQPAGRLRSALAAGRVVEEDAYSVEFPFDGQTCHAIATFVSDPQILIGTNLLRQHVLQIRFTSKAVRLERE